jgi:phage-related protein
MPAYKTISIATTIEKNKIASDVPFVVTLDITVKNAADGTTGAIFRIVKNTEDLTIGGNVYTAADFNVELKEESGAQPQITVSIADYGRAIQQMIEPYGGGVGSSVIVGVVNVARLSAPPEVQEFFEVTGTSASDYHVMFTLGAENPLMKLFPRRQQAKDYCAWLYKSLTTCRYAGPKTTCDLTLNGANGCKAHQNEINFGAFPGINNAGARYF